MIRSQDIHARIGAAGWPIILVSLGIGEAFLRKKAGPCPACGGTDRYTFDNRKGRGDFLCRHCGAGDAFQLLERVHGWKFSEARRRVMVAAGLVDDSDRSPMPCARAAPVECEPSIASPTERVHRLRRGTCPIENCADAVEYLSRRGLWPLPKGCPLRAHASVEYFHEQGRIGRFAAIVADIQDVRGELVTTHVTYLANGWKLKTHDPRKILSPMTGRSACAVRLMPLAGDVLGISEGVETALSAAFIEEIPVWSAINTSLLAKFEPPEGVAELVIFADRDDAGLIAANTLAERIQGRVRFRIRPPPPPSKDWNDVLMKKLRDER